MMVNLVFILSRKSREHFYLNHPTFVKVNNGLFFEGIVCSIFSVEVHPYVIAPHTASLPMRP